jgi:hypothetical protein
MAATTAALLESTYMSAAGALLPAHAASPTDELLPDDSLNLAR